MNRRIWFVSLFVLVACTFGVASLASAGEEEKGQILFVEEVTVKPSGAEAYEKAIKDFQPILAEHGFPFSYEVYSTDTFKYYVSYPIDSYADMDKIREAWMKLLEAWGWDKYEEMEKQVSGAYESYRFMVMRTRPSLSYNAEQHPYDPTKANYIYWGFCYVKPGKERAFEKNFKGFVSMFSEKEVPFGWTTFQGDVGTEMPAYLYAEWADSPSDFWATAEKASEKVGADAEALWKETLSLMRRYEFETGKNRPDLSYRPAKETPAEE